MSQTTLAYSVVLACLAGATVVSVFFSVSTAAKLNAEHHSLRVSKSPQAATFPATSSAAAEATNTTIRIPAASARDETKEESLSELRRRLPPSVWTVAGRNNDADVAKIVNGNLSAPEREKAMQLCGKFLYSSLRRAVQVGDMGEQTFVATGDIGRCRNETVLDLHALLLSLTSSSFYPIRRHVD